MQTHCPECSSTSVIKNGTYPTKAGIKQRFRCKVCDSKIYLIKKTLNKSCTQINITVDRAVILNQKCDEISFEETVLVLDEVDFYQTKKQRIRFYQTEQLLVHIDRSSKLGQQATKNEIKVVDSIVTTDSFDDIVPTGFLPLLLNYAQQQDLFSLFNHLNFSCKRG